MPEIEDDAPFIAEDRAEESNRKMQEFFGAKTIKDVQLTREAVVAPPGPEDLEALSAQEILELAKRLRNKLGKLEITALDEPALRMLRMVRSSIKELDELNDELTATLKELVGKDRGLLQRGDEAILVEASAPARRLSAEKTEAYIYATIGADGVKEWRQSCYSGGDGEPSVRLKVIPKSP